MRLTLAYRTAFYLSLVAYWLCFVGGMTYFVAVHRALPGLDLDPLRDARRYLANGDVRRAAREYRVASRIATTEWQTSRVAAALAARFDDSTLEIDKYLRARDLWPRDPATHRALARAYLQNGRFDEAMTSLHHALRIDPRSAVTHAAIGEAFLEKDEYTQAVHSFQAALVVDPRAADVHNSLGIAYILGGRSAEAVAAFSEAVRLRPSPQFMSNLERARAERGAPAAGTP